MMAIGIGVGVYPSTAAAMVTFTLLFTVCILQSALTAAKNEGGREGGSLLMLKLVEGHYFGVTSES